MKILITGANGLLGRKLIDQFAALPGISLIATSKGKKRFEPVSDQITYDELDITDPKQCAGVLSRHNSQVIIHTAAITQVDFCQENKKLCYDTNVTGVKNLLENLPSPDSHFIHLSTDFVFDGKQGPYDEKAPPNPVNYYGECKWLAEELVLRSGIRSAIVRTILVYGYCNNLRRSNLILWVKENLEKKKNIKVVGDQVRTPTLVEDLAAGCRLIAEKKQTGIFNIGGPETLTPWDMAQQVAGFYRLDASLMEKVHAGIFSQVAVRPLVTGLIIDKARNLLGYEPHSFKEGIQVLDSQIRAVL